MFSLLTNVAPERAKNLSPVTLAFVGDAVYSLYVREKLALSTDYSAGALQKITSAEVSAHGQNGLLEKILPLFTEDELSVYRRGRNAKKTARSKSATVAEYNRSTGFEAVLGYLYLTGNVGRIDFLLGAQDENRG